MLGTKTIGRGLVFGLGYLAGTRAGKERYDQLSTTLARIQTADAIERLQSLPAYLDTDIGRRTLESYKPAVPVTMEGILYAGGGFILGYLVLSGLWRFVTLPFKRRRYAAYR